MGVYSLLMTAAQPLLRRKLRRRGVSEPGYLQNVEERFGRYEGPTEPGRLWLHAVSLGETRAAAVLLQALRERRPDLRFLLTHGTATGREQGRALLREGDVQAWMPWDTPAAVRRFLAHFRPAAGILIETEVWPNMAALCAEQGVPLALANARLSEKSLSRVRKLPGLARRAYGSLRAVWAQTEADARRLAEAGATVHGVFGNLKFDATPDPAQLRLGRDWHAAARAPLVMFASSREGEEAEFLAALRAHPGVQWLLVPRHPQRFDEVAAQVAQAGFTVSRRSTWSDAPAPADVWLGDSLGEMPLYYAMANVALLGGSFAPLGGQNLIEAAACGCPVVMGPHTFNFGDAAELAMHAGAARRGATMQEGVATAVMWTRDVGGLRQACRSGEEFAAMHRGATVKTANAVMALLT